MMNRYQQGDINPPLSDIEQLMYDLANNLLMAMCRHRFEDPTSPPPPALCGLEDLAAIKSAMGQWRAELMKHMKERGPVQPKPHVPLANLWPLIDPPASLGNPSESNNDLMFDDFGLCQRYIDEQQSPAGWLPRWYVVAIPRGERSLRCVATEVSGRNFCTATRRSQCNPPAMDDFRPVKVSGIGVNFKTGERRPTIMTIYLPGCYGPWSMIKHRDGEQLVSDDEP